MIWTLKAGPETLPPLTRCRIKSASDGGCDFPVDPLRDVPAANIFWEAGLDTSVVLLTQSPSELPNPGGRSQTTFEGILRTDDRGDGLLRSGDSAQRVQFLLTTETRADAPLAAAIPLDLDGFDRAEALLRLLAMLHGRAIPSDTRLTRQQLARQRKMLRAFDAHRDGATQQEIARVIFGAGQLSRDEWQASSNRHAVMSLLRDARALIAGGYRKLLRHRRRS